jgi:hypothetical protein
MRNTVKKTVVGALAALTLSAAVIGATPASAGGWHHHHYGFWGPGVALGVLGLAAGAMAASEYECVRYQPIYDAYGNYVGRRAVNVC